MNRQGLEKEIVLSARKISFGGLLLFLLLMLFLPASLLAAVPQVICVPQLPSDLLVPHETWSGEPTILKGVARDEDGDLTGGTYYWKLGDGEESLPQSITNPDNLAVTHTYAADPDTLFIARLHVTDTNGESSSDQYRILIKAKTLDVEVNKAIDDGLWWLYKRKQSTGPSYYRWNNSRAGNHYANTTASAVQAYEINGHLETGNPDEDPYVNAVHGGIDYLLTTLRTYNMSLQGGEDPDSNGNGVGLSVNNNRRIYETGAVMDAFVASGTPDAIARVGGANVLGRRYQDIVQDMVDMYAWGESGGGWRYSWNSGSDNSAAQWGAIGMVAAERHFDCTVPQWVKDKNDSWLNNSYNSAGYFGYTGKSAHRWGYATGPSGMVQLSFGGKNVSDSRWLACEQYLADHWDHFIGWNSSTQSYTRNDCRHYAYYPFAKAMRLALPQEVTHLPGGLDWYGDETRGLARVLVDTQNANGSWPYDGWPYVGERTAAAWNVIILTRTLFEKPPVAIIHAEPNPGAVGQTIQLDASDSYHVDPAKEIDEYLWDFDASDGVDFEHPDSTGTQTSHTYGDLRDYIVSLKVIDNSTPERFDISTLTMHITIPPHPPTAVIGGPYIAAAGEEIRVDGSGSYDIDESEGDSITAWDWESDFVAPYDFNEAHGETAILPPLTEPGRYDIAMRVTDNTAAVFPSSGQPNLTHVAYGEVTVYKVGVTDLAARPKATKCQLTWTHIGVDNYEVLRSEKGPNEGFELIGTTSSTYSTFLDYNVELYKDYWYRIRCERNGETVLSAPVHVNSLGRILNQPPVITSDPVTETQEGVLYQYDVEATDPESTALTYLLDQAPDGMNIDAVTGFVTWTPSFDQVGVNDVLARVQDAGSASATQFFQIIVSPRPNDAPLADPNGPYSALTDEVIAFDSSGSSDPDGDPVVEYHWVFGDGNDAYGVQVSHAYTAAGTYTVTLYATDNRGATGSAETTCQIEIPNRVPIAAAGGPYDGEVNTPIIFDGSQSYDPDGDQLTYTWNFGDSTPAETGVTVSHIYVVEGTYQATLNVDDGQGGTDTNETTVAVSPPNQPPVADFTVQGDIVKWATLTFDATGSSDPEGRPLVSWEWDFGDHSSTTGAIVTHGYAEPGDYTVTLTVTDDKGATGTAQQTLTVAHPEPNHDPIIDAGGPYKWPINTAITLTATGADPDGDELTYAWSYGGQTYSGQSVELSFDTIGTHEVQLSAEDGYGGTAQDVALVMAYDPDAPVDQVPPEVSITAPLSGDTLSGVVDIQGSVTDENLAGWVLECVPAGSHDWIEISSGTEPVTDGLLGRINMGLLPDDLYRLRLTANDYNQSSSTWIECKVNDPVKLGRFSITYEDLRLPAMGMTLSIMRTYDSTRKIKGDFGIGWTLDIKTAEIREDAGHNVFVTLPDGRRVAFAFTPVRMSPWFPFYEARFTAPPGVFDELDIVGNRMVVYTGGDWYFFLDSRGKFNPDIYILKTKQGLTYTIDQDVGVTRVEDRNSNYVEINENGIISSCGRSVNFERDTEGRILSMVDPAGNELHYAYDADGDLVAYRDQEDKQTGYHYNNNHYLLEIESPDGCTPVKNEYYPDGRLAAHEDNTGNRTTYVYDVENHIESVTNAHGNTATYRYDGSGDVIEVLDPLGTSTHYTYDANNNKTSVTSPSGQIVTFTYDGRGNKLTESYEPEPGNLLTYSYTYNVFAQPTSVTKPLGDRVVYSYNTNGNLTRRQAQDSSGQVLSVETYTYDANGNRLTWQDANGKTSTYEYNVFGDLTRETDPTGVTTLYEYDVNGNRIALVDGLGNRTEFEFSGYNKMTALRHDSQILYTISHNDLGEMTTVTDAIGHTMTFDYDCLGNMVRVEVPDGAITQYEYNETSNLQAVIDANGHRTEYVYDAMNRQLVRRGPDNRTWGFDYTPDGYLETFATPNGAVTRNEYDGMNRLVRVVQPERTVDYEYNDNINLVQVTEHSNGIECVTAYIYDALGHLLRITDPQGRVITYDYDACGRRTRMTTPDGLETAYIYDDAGRILQIQTGSDWVRFGYDLAGQRVQTEFSNGAITSYTYDSLGRLTGVMIKDNTGAVVASYDYTLDANGHRVGVTLADGTASYSLDSLYRLTQESVNSTSMGTYVQSFAYDTVGNLLIPGAGYGADNRLLNDDSGLYGYDDNGNVVSRGAEIFEYDTDNRLVAYTNGAATASYQYDYLGRRVAKTVNGDVLGFIYDAENIVTEYVNGIQAARYTHGLGMDEPLMVVRDGHTYFYHTDGLGSVVAMTDETGQVVQRYGYDAWGNIVYTDGPFAFSGIGQVNTLTYTAREYDEECDLYHYRARAYDPSLGRFLQKDRQQGKLYLPQTQNLYAYGLNNPVNFVDPTGQMALISYTSILVLPTHNDLAAALAGFLHGFSGTNIVFVGEFMGLIPIENSVDLARTWEEAISRTISRMNDIKWALGIIEEYAGEAANAGDPFKLMGSMAAFKSGAQYKVGFDIKIIDESVKNKDGDKPFVFTKSPGGFAEGVNKALKYLGQLQPK